MAKKKYQRADDETIKAGESFKPGASPDRWIEQHSTNYAERPIAVLRELIQNAADSVLSRPEKDRMIEVAVLNKNTKLPDSKYHLVVRDSGDGMSEEELRLQVGILGMSSKINLDEAIGEFGVGFYATHAICREVTVLSQKNDHPITAWKYIPADKVFHPLSTEELGVLTSLDFENYPREIRRRSNGTSVYLNIDLDEYPKCTDWLSAAKLATDLRRDCCLLPTTIYVADYTIEQEGSEVLDYNGKDIRNESLSLIYAPWECDPLAKENAVKSLLSHTNPYVEESELPQEWFCFKKPVDDGEVAGFLYLMHNTSSESVDLFLKRIRVETAADIKPHWADSLLGFINFNPGKSKSMLKVPPARDHVIRNNSYFRASQAVEDACVEFFTEMGDELTEKLRRILDENRNPDNLASTVMQALGNSQFFIVSEYITKRITRLLKDIPETLCEVVNKEDLNEKIRTAIVRFAKETSGIDEEIITSNLSQALKTMQKIADESFRKGRLAQPGLREKLQFNPRATKTFLSNCSKFLPLTVHHKEYRDDNKSWDIRSFRIPACCICYIEPEMASTIKVLTEGESEDYFRKNTTARSILVPDSHFELIQLVLTAHMTPKFPTLTFESIRKDLFEDLAIRDAWNPLLDIFKEIVAKKEEHKEHKDTIEFDARGFDIEHVPLLLHDEDDKSYLIINAYCQLMKELLRVHETALEKNDRETIKLIAYICHELYHHSVHSRLSKHHMQAQAHYFNTRSELLREMLNMLDRYSNLKFRTSGED